MEASPRFKPSPPPARLSLPLRLFNDPIVGQKRLVPDEPRTCCARLPGGC